MCNLVEIKKGAVPSNISIEFERDASLRAVEVVIINHNRAGIERSGVQLACFDNGLIEVRAVINDLQDGVSIDPCTCKQHPFAPAPQSP